MKLISIVCTLLSLTFSTLKAQSFEETLKSSFAKFDTATSVRTRTEASSKLDTLELQNPDKWAGHFYSAYAHILLSFALTDKQQRDRYLDAADTSLLKADKLSPNNEEIFILRAYAAKARIPVNPQNRWKKYGDIYSELITKAKKLNPENPRIYFLEGMDPFWTPKIYGGGKDKARPFFQKAKELFAKEDKSDLLKPYWGEHANEKFLKQCDE